MTSSTCAIGSGTRGANSAASRAKRLASLGYGQRLERRPLDEAQQPQHQLDLGLEQLAVSPYRASAGEQQLQRGGQPRERPHDERREGFENRGEQGRRLYPLGARGSSDRSGAVGLGRG